ncbi:MAG: alpha/beta fold hydrolase [Desulfobacterales bacterium]|nr:alpha/beta fold hydrolase [Desulfobacterales bacterium]
MTHPSIKAPCPPRLNRHDLHCIIALLLLTGLVIGGCSASSPPLPGPDFEPARAWVDQIQAPPELKRAIKDGRQTTIAVASGYDIAVRIYGQAGDKTPVVMTHGLQSHSGWFAQSAALMASQGHPVYAVDRRGSGLSKGPRGDMKAFDEMIDDLLVVADYVARQHGTHRFFLLGHCFGAIPATAFAIRHPERIAGLILTTPAIYTHTGLPLSQMLRILFSRSGKRDFLVPSPLDPSEFTELASFETFIRSDPLALRAATGDFYFQVHRARKFITANIETIEMPVFMAIAGEDPISDNRRNIRFFEDLPADDKMMINYEDARHILEFSPERERFLNDLAFWLIRETAFKE